MFTTLDPTTALVVIDLQKGITGLDLTHPAENVVARSAALAAAFRKHGLPVVLVNVEGTPPGRTDAGSGAPRTFSQDWAELVPELDRQPGDHVVTKYARSAFAGTGLADLLLGLGVTQVVVVGISTSGGVESTARSAHEEGFHVSLPIDAMTDRTPESHDYSIQKIFPRIAETGTTEDLIKLLDGTRS
jgi:nicotinamidase-related amidase